MPADRDPSGAERAILARRAAALSAPEADTTVEADQVVVLVRGGRSYAVPAHQVREVLEAGPVSALPSRHHRLVGGRARRGSLLPLADVAVLTGAGPAADPGTCFVVVLDDRDPIGLLAETVTTRDQSGQASRTLAEGVVAGLTEDGTALIDVDALLADRRLVAAADRSAPVQPRGAS